jgi:purine-binding chemotaxis protein CheW
VKQGRAYAAALDKDLVRLEVDGVWYALEVGRIREIVNPLPIVELPRERAFVVGVADYRDEVVPVVDLRLLFGLPSRVVDRRTKWIIVDARPRLVAVVVDAVLDVFSSDRERQRQIPVLDERHVERGISSAFRHDEHLVFLLDADRLAEPAALVSPNGRPGLPSEAP